MTRTYKTQRFFGSTKHKAGVNPTKQWDFEARYAVDDETLTHSYRARCRSESERHY